MAVLFHHRRRYLPAPLHPPSPEITAKAPEAAELLRLTAPDLQRLGVIDGIVPEPVGGAHRNWEETAAALRQALRDHLWELKGKTPDQLLSARYEKFRKIGVFEETA